MTEYDEIISFGSNCNPGLSLKELGIKKETYPFDWVRTNAKILYDILISGKEKYLIFGQTGSDDYFLKDLHSYTNPGFPRGHINYYGQHFTHYTSESTDAIVVKFSRYLDRFFQLLNSQKTVLFIHSNEEYIYHKKSRDAKVELYDYLCRIVDHLELHYPGLNFTILNIDIHNDMPNYKRIKNINISYTIPLSDKCQHHLPAYYNKYRNSVTKEIREFLQLK